VYPDRSLSCVIVEVTQGLAVDGGPGFKEGKMNQLGALYLNFQTWDFAPEPIELRVTQRRRSTSPSGSTDANSRSRVP
jgi:hypothetical protein